MRISAIDGAPDGGPRVVFLEPNQRLVEAIPGLVSLGAVVVVAPKAGPGRDVAELLSALPSENGGAAQKGLEVDRHSRLASWNGRQVRLTNLEFEILEALTREAGRAWSFKELRLEAWGDQNPHNGDLNAVRAAVQRLREKLASAGADVAIDSVRGYGFRLSPGNKKSD